jgi:hypothetical protein
MKQFKSLRQDRSLDDADAGDVASRSVDAGDKTDFHRIAAAAFKDDWNCGGRGPGRQRRPVAAGREDCGHGPTNQLRRKSRQQVVVTFRVAIIDHYVLAIDKPQLLQAFVECRGIPLIC